MGTRTQCRMTSLEWADKTGTGQSDTTGDSNTQFGQGAVWQAFLTYNAELEISEIEFPVSEIDLEISKIKFQISVIIFRYMIMNFQISRNGNI